MGGGMAVRTLLGLSFLTWGASGPALQALPSICLVSGCPRAEA